MNERVLDDPARKRDLLYTEKATDDSLNAMADLFIDRERYGEALEFLERTRDPERLSRIRADALERGDTFLLLRVERLSGERVGPETWRKAAGNALALGKFYDAYRGYDRSGDEERAESIRAEHMPDYEPFRPEGK